MQTATEQLLTDVQVAELLNMKPHTLRCWRSEGHGPSYIRIGTRTVRYALEDVLDFLERSRCQNGERE